MGCLVCWEGWVLLGSHLAIDTGCGVQPVLCKPFLDSKLEQPSLPRSQAQLKAVGSVSLCSFHLESVHPAFLPGALGSRLGHRIAVEVCGMSTLGVTGAYTS